MNAAILQIAAIVQLGLAKACAHAAASTRASLRDAAEIERLKVDLALTREELRIKDLRLALFRPAERPRYPPTSRLDILALQQARHWNNAQTAKVFQLSPPTIATWNRRIDDPNLVRTPTPINKLPEFVDEIARRLKSVAPRAGKRRIAQTLARVGIAVAASSVGRILKRPGSPTPTPPSAAVVDPRARKANRKIVAKHPNHVWHVDLTVAPVLGGFRIPWLPWALPPCWPFAFWVTVVLDRYSRCALAFDLSLRQPGQRQICLLLSRAERKAGTAPKAIITDQGEQFGADYRSWCEQRGVKPRYGAIQKSTSIAILERFFRTLKSECLRIAWVAFRPSAMRVEIECYLRWYHLHRPHQGLGGQVPADRWPVIQSADRSSLRRGKRKRKRHRPQVEILPFEGRAYLPVVQLRRAA